MRRSSTASSEKITKTTSKQGRAARSQSSTRSRSRGDRAETARKSSSSTNKSTRSGLGRWPDKRDVEDYNHLINT